MPVPGARFSPPGGKKGGSSVGGFGNARNLYHSGGKSEAKPPTPAAPSPAGAPVVRIAPEQKILLLHGPPGAGKTSLAHILARHAGYRPMEINARYVLRAVALRSAGLSITFLPYQ
jgi:hypothetical protein